MSLSQVKFQFVTVTSSAPELTAETRGLIKKHVMKDIGLARRKYGSIDALKPSIRKHTSPTLFVSHPKVGSVWVPEESEEVVRSAEDFKPQVGPVTRLPHPTVNIGVGISDPFNSFPIQGGSEVYLLIDHINDDTHASFKLFREYWLPVSVQDPGAFQCTLALAARHRMTGYPQDSSGRDYFMRQYVSYNDAAIRSVKDRIGDPLQSTSDNIIAAILLLTCDHTSSSAATNFMRHMNAMETIIQLRGGMETLDSNKKLRLLLFWIDTIGSSALNSAPKFPEPTQFLPSFDGEFKDRPRPRLPTSVSKEWAATFPSHFELIAIFDDLCALTVMVENEALRPHPVQDPKFTGFYILPLVHRLFSLEPDWNDSSQERMVFEACKLSAFLFLQHMRRFVAIRYPCLREPFIDMREESSATLASSTVQRLDVTLLGHSTVWTALRPLKCWVLTVCANTPYIVPAHLVDLALLTGSPCYGSSCCSMGPLMQNSWTIVFKGGFVG